WIRALDCCQKRTSPVSRKSQPLPTTPWSRGVLPVRIDAWAVQVTAGTASRSGRDQPDEARAFRRGAIGSRRPVRPTALMRTSGAGVVDTAGSVGVCGEVPRMTNGDPDRNRPPYSYVPGGPWPHPIREPGGHSFGHRAEPVPPIVGDDWRSST